MCFRCADLDTSKHLEPANFLELWRSQAETELDFCSLTRIDLSASDTPVVLDFRTVTARMWMNDARVRVRRIVFSDHDESSAELLHDPSALVRSSARTSVCCHGIMSDSGAS